MLSPANAKDLSSPTSLDSANNQPGQSLAAGFSVERECPLEEPARTEGHRSQHNLGSTDLLTSLTTLGGLDMLRHEELAATTELVVLAPDTSSRDPPLVQSAHDGSLPSSGTAVAFTTPEPLCSVCGTTNSPKWHRGGGNSDFLCNACGLRVRISSGSSVQSSVPMDAPGKGSREDADAERAAAEVPLADTAESQLASSLKDRDEAVDEAKEDDDDSDEEERDRKWCANIHEIHGGMFGCSLWAGHAGEHELPSRRTRNRHETTRYEVPDSNIPQLQHGKAKSRQATKPGTLAGFKMKSVRPLKANSSPQSQPESRIGTKSSVTSSHIGGKDGAMQDVAIREGLAEPQQKRSSVVPSVRQATPPSMGARFTTAAKVLLERKASRLAVDGSPPLCSLGQPPPDSGKRPANLVEGESAQGGGSVYSKRTRSEIKPATGMLQQDIPASDITQSLQHTIRFNEVGSASKSSLPLRQPGGEAQGALKNAKPSSCGKQTIAHPLQVAPSQSVQCRSLTVYPQAPYELASDNSDTDTSDDSDEGEGDELCNKVSLALSCPTY